MLSLRLGGHRHSEARCPEMLREARERTLAECNGLYPYGLGERQRMRFFLDRHGEGVKSNLLI